VIVGDYTAELPSANCRGRTGRTSDMGRAIRLEGRVRLICREHATTPSCQHAATMGTMALQLADHAVSTVCFVYDCPSGSIQYDALDVDDRLHTFVGMAFNLRADLLPAASAYPMACSAQFAVMPEIGPS
jgi:hypothetical protein